MILLIPPELGSPQAYINGYCRREGIEYPVIEEIEPRAGCRCFMVRCWEDRPEARSARVVSEAPKGQAEPPNTAP